MKKKVSICFVSLVFTLFAVSLVLAANVAQGKCISYDTQKKILIIEEYDTDFGKENPHGKPTGVQTVFNVEKALIGLTPEPGDILRIAYTVKDTEKVAIKVMNVSKQDLRKK
ncbi:MAG: hypothetical protein V1689_06925 [Pseudomonadota bacterium]